MMRSVLLLSILLILFSGSHFSAEAAPRIPKHPDQALIRNVIHGFPGWKLNSSGRCAQMRQSGLWAWKIVLERNIDPTIKSSASLNGKGYIIIVIVPDVGIDPGRGLIEHLDWNMPGNDLVQYTAYLGRGKGYYWYMKSDIGRLNSFSSALGLRGGDNMNRMMAEALNVIDYKLYTSRVAVEYFRNKGPDVVPLILKSMESWKQSEKQLPLQHLFALKLTGSIVAGEALMKIAASRNHTMAHQALQLLVEPPYLATESFYRKVLRVPEYTDKTVQIFRERKQYSLILDDLRKILKKPRSLKQYADALAAVREFQNPAAFTEIPEYAAVNHIMYQVMRMGDTPDTIRYVAIEGQGQGSTKKLDEHERRRIQPYLDVLKKSQDMEAAFAAGLALATFSPVEKEIAKEYILRIRKIGIEILQMLPTEIAINKIDDLLGSVRNPKEQNLLRLVKSEYLRR